MQISLNFKSFLLLLKNETSGSKAVSGFSIILILKGVMAFLETQFYRGEPCASPHTRISN